MSNNTILPNNHINVLASKMILHLHDEMVDFDQIVCVELRTDEDEKPVGFNIRIKGHEHDPWQYNFVDDDTIGGIKNYEQLVELYDQYKAAKYLLKHGHFAT
jgi:hypothetical protein